MFPLYRLNTVCAALLLTACAAQTRFADRAANPLLTSHNIQTDPDICAEQLGGTSNLLQAELDSSDIQFLNWNIHKGEGSDWSNDLEAFSEVSDLITLQEVALDTEDWAIITEQQFRSFAPGYQSATSATGVMTISSAQPLTQCNLVSIEPWLSTPKATVITEYGLTASDQTLVVINIHLVNFSIGTRIFKEQLLQAYSVVNQHSGPILLSGDFNTWRSGRAKILRELTDSLGLEELNYQEDHRKQFFGQLLDHIFVRNLEVIEATTNEVNSSDHNPMTVRLRL